MYTEVKSYLTLLEKIGELIKASKYKTEYIMSELRMKKATFYNKLQNSNFTPKEMLRLAEILEPEEKESYERRLIDKVLKISRNQVEQGKTENFINTLTEIKQELNERV